VVAKTYGFNYFYIGLIMTASGIMTVIGGRMSGKLAAKIGARKVLSLRLVSAAVADIIIYLYRKKLVMMIFGIALWGLVSSLLIPRFSQGLPSLLRRPEERPCP
jgi:predicted MFS family arabinose efflux permease